MEKKKYWEWKITWLKTCTICLIEQKVENFRFIQWTRPNTHCKECSKAYSKKWKEANPEKDKEYLKKYQRNNREKLSKKWIPAAKKRYYANKEAILTRKKELYNANPEKYRQAVYESVKKNRFNIGDLVIHRNALYRVIRRTKGWFYIEKERPHLDEYYYDFAPINDIVERALLKKYRG